MKIRLSECDFEYLRPPKEVFKVTHSDHYIRHGEGSKAVRKIFENVSFTQDELVKLEEFKAAVAKEHIQVPADWTQIDYIKMMYAGKFDFKKAIKLMKLHLEWRASPDRGLINPPAFKFIQDGILYISGRDKQYRPVIVLNVYKIDTKHLDPKALVEALWFILDVAIKFYFVPGKVENWVFIIETNGVGFFGFPFKVIKTVNDATSVNYTSRLDKLYITNPPSFLKTSWNIIHGFLDPETASKIFMLKKSEFGQLLEKIDPDQLEQRYGGKLNLTSFWPPINTLKEPPYTKLLENEAVAIPRLEDIKLTGSAGVKNNIIQEKYEEVKIQTQENPKENRGTYTPKEVYSPSPEKNSPAVNMKPESSSPKQKGNENIDTQKPAYNRESSSPVVMAHALEVTSPEKLATKETEKGKEQAFDGQGSPEDKKQVVEGMAEVMGLNLGGGEPLYAERQGDLGFETNQGTVDLGEKHKKAHVKAAPGEYGEEDLDNRQEINGKRTNGKEEIILEGSSSKMEFCGFCRPRENSDSKGSSNNCNMF